MNIHPTAAVSPHAQLGVDISIGPFCIVEHEVTIGERCVLEGRVTIKSGTQLGADNLIAEGAVIGGIPQHLTIPQKMGGIVIGSGNVIRENATIHRALKAGNVTTVGDNNLLMVNAHVAHDCLVGNNVILANNTMLAGHVIVQDRAFLSGAVGVHQFCRIGRLAMVGGHARCVQDIPPYVTIDGNSGCVVGLNLIGLRRNGYTSPQVAELKRAYRLIYRSGLKWTEVLERLQQEFTEGPAADFHAFLSGGTRGFVHERRVPASATIKLRTEEAPAEATELRAKAG